MVYPMDTAWLDGRISADHYRHTRLAYYRQLVKAGLVETFERQPTASDHAPAPAHRED